MALMVNDRLEVPLQIPALEAVESRPSEPVEADLGGLLNLWDTVLTSPVTDYPVFGVERVDNTEKTSLLIIGDSFLFVSHQNLPLHCLAHQIPGLQAWFQPIRKYVNLPLPHEGWFYAYR